MWNHPDFHTDEINWLAYYNYRFTVISDKYEVVIVLIVLYRQNIYIYIYYPGNLWPSINYIPIMTKHPSDVVRRGAWWVVPCWHRRTPQRLPDRPCQGFPILDDNHHHDIHIHTYTYIHTYIQYIYIYIIYIYIYRAMLGRSGLYNKYIIVYVYTWYTIISALKYLVKWMIYKYMYKHMFNMTIPNILA